MNMSRSLVAACWQGNTPVSAGPHAMSPAAAMTGSAARAGAAPAPRAARTAINAPTSTTAWTRPRAPCARSVMCWERTIMIRSTSAGVDEAHAPAAVRRLRAPRRGPRVGVRPRRRPRGGGRRRLEAVHGRRRLRRLLHREDDPAERDGDDQRADLVACGHVEHLVGSRAPGSRHRSLRRGVPDRRILKLVYLPI